MQTAVGGTLTQNDEKGRDRVIAYYSKRLNPAEENYTSNDRELPGLVYFLKRFRCYLEGSTFEVLTDNQVLKNFLTKKRISRREARWPDLFAEFNLDKNHSSRGQNTCPWRCHFSNPAATVSRDYEHITAFPNILKLI